MLGFPLIVANDIENMRIEEAARQAALVCRCRRTTKGVPTAVVRILAGALVALIQALQARVNVLQEMEWNDVS
jgi:acyl CoA:acetate/3-ketoacid CoA transferase alpha subunit